ncbi:Acid phosphatase [Spathaspora sp. JA1]|nr:Acid phosphatase [Spathaspora sp. JA1]
MQLLTIVIALLSATVSLVNAGRNPLARCKNILLTNDDGWSSTNIRATYYKLKEAGYNVFMVAPAIQRSGFGGSFGYPESPTLESDGGYGHPPAGSPSWGHEEYDDHIWYFNATPASCVAFGVTYLPLHFKKPIEFDLVVSGPNEGSNMSPGMFTISATLGAAYNAVYRGIPAIAASGKNDDGTFFQTDMDLNDEMSPSTTYATMITEVVDQLLNGYGRALPVGIGLNVNFPKVGYLDEDCIRPQWHNTRMTGAGACGGDLSYDETTKKWGWQRGYFEALQTVCESGDCKLPSENYIVEHTNCSASISVFSIDYDAEYCTAKKVLQSIGDIFQPTHQC